MKANLIEDLNIAKIKGSTSGQKVLKYAEAISNGAPRAKSSKESNALWKRWKAGDNNAMDLYVRSNVWLFVEVSFRLKSKYYSMDLQDIFSTVLGFTKEAFEGYDDSSKATLISYHSHYAQYRVSHIFETMSPLSYKQRQVLRKAKRLSFEEDLDLYTALSHILRSNKMCQRFGVEQGAKKIIELSKPLDSLDRSISLERDSMLLGETMQAPKEDVVAPLDLPANKRQLERIKKYLAQDLRDRDKFIFQGMLKGMSDYQIAKENKITTETIRHARKRIFKKAGHRASILKAQGIELSDLF